MERYSFACVARHTLKRCEKEKKHTAKASWIHRQWNDPYVKQARRENLRSRAAFKLRDLNKKFDIIRHGDTVLDLGAAPGGWTQIAAMESCGEYDRDRRRVIAVDLVPMQIVEGASIVMGDFRDSSTRNEIGQLLEGRMVDVVLSDMAPRFTGHFLKDSQQQLRLCYNALLMAELYLKVGGNFVTKVLQSEDLEDFRGQMKTQFKSVKGYKPSSSRSESTELFFIGKEYRGNSEATRMLDPCGIHFHGSHARIMIPIYTMPCVNQHLFRSWCRFAWNTRIAVRIVSLIKLLFVNLLVYLANHTLYTMNRSIFIAFDDFSRAGKYVLSSMKVNGKETSPNSNFDAYPHLTKSATLTTWLCNSDEVLLVSLDTNCVSSLWELTSNLLDWILQLEQDLKAKSLHSSDFNDVFHYQASILDNANVPIQCDAFNQFENVWKISDSFLCQFLYLLGIEQFTRTQVHGIFAKGYRPGQYPQLEGSRDAILRLSSALSHATARYKCIKIDPQVAWNRLEQDATAGCYDNGYKMAQSIYN